MADDRTWPKAAITLDGYPPNHLALRLLRREDPKWNYVRTQNDQQYLNNIIE